MPVEASGEQVVLASGDLRMTVVTAGGGIRELTRGDWTALQGYGIDELPPGGSGQPLIPWPNRIADGRYQFRGERHQLPITEPDKGNALHGFARWMTWRVERASGANAVLSLLMYPRSGYPFALHVKVEYTLHPTGVDVVTTAVNAGRAALPYACGFHPYLCAGSASIDSDVLEVGAETWLPTDARQIPTGRENVEGTPYDFRARRVIGSLALDTAYTNLERDSSGKARVKLSDAGDSRSVSVWMDRSYQDVMVYTGDKLDLDRRRKGLAVEPMTAAPNAFRSGDGLRVLEPGESFACAWGIDIAQRQS